MGLPSMAGGLNGEGLCHSFEPNSKAGCDIRTSQGPIFKAKQWSYWCFFFAEVVQVGVCVPQDAVVRSRQVQSPPKRASPELPSRDKRISLMGNNGSWVVVGRIQRLAMANDGQ